MGRRRWRVVTIAAILLFMIKGTQCQEENDFYYTPVERNFAQVQPHLYPNTRPGAFYEQGDNYRAGTSQQQQPLYDGHVRFPSPNYNQNPSPFQLPTGRSQSGTQFYVNQPDYTGTPRQRYRPALPYNYQVVPHPASTKRPDVSQIHSLAYQHDPSKPETFLGQITINNPDLDYLQNSRFKNVPFDGNSLKSNGQSGHIPRDEDIDGNHRDIFDHPRVTTYNPNNHLIKQRLNIRPTSIRQPQHESSISYSDEEDRIPISSEKINDSKNNQKLRSPNLKPTENKSILDLEPFLEDEITDLSFKELMKNTHDPDVQVIQSNKSSNLESTEDSKPDASSMNADNLPQEIPRETATRANNRDVSTTTKTTSTSSTHSPEHHSEEDLEDGEYVEYYDETESSEQHHTTRAPASTEHVTDIYDEYDTTDETESSTDELKANTTAFHVLEMNPAKTMVKDDNFKEFVDTTVIDQSEQEEDDIPGHEPAAVPSTKTPVTNEDVTSIETPSILGQEVVSVVTTKSVVNGTISIPDVTFAPSTKKTEIDSQFQSKTSHKSSTSTTENYLVVASVQTSRSVSGARFLPFPAVAQEDKKQVLLDESEEEETVTKDPGLDTKGLLISSSSTENINDKLDSIQSELSSAVLSGSLDNQNKNIELITESTTTEPTTRKQFTTTNTTTPPSVNVFTLKSTQLPTATEKSGPEPPAVNIKKFTHRLSTSTTPKPKKKPSFVTVMDDLQGFLPPGYRPRNSFKDKRTSTTTTTTTTTTPLPVTSVESEVNVTQGRSSGINSKNRVILLDDKSLLPKEYKPKEKPVVEEILKKVPKVDVSQFLPPGYKLPKSEKNSDELPTKPELPGKVQKIDLSAILPKGFKLNTTTEKPEAKLAITAKPVDITAFLPPGFKLNDTEVKKINSPIEIKVADISNLLPPGFKLDKTEESSEEAVTSSTTTKAPGAIKVVFPSRPAGKGNRKTTTPRTSIGPVPVTPKIMKGWPTRASTEFTGWPSPSTTPFSIETFLNKSGTVAASPADISTEPTTRRITTTTTTTAAPPPSTTPGICRKDCDIAATIKIVAGVQWVPELLDHNTKEWQNLAKEVKDELNSVYSKSNLLKKYYKGIRIDGFSKGSVLVDYFVELNDVEDRLDTLTLKKLFHKSLNEAAPGSVVDVVQGEQNGEFDADAMMGDQPEEERMTKTDEKMTKTIDNSAGKLEIGKFVMDPAYTEFIVLPKRDAPKSQVEMEDESFLPQWGIAVIVITLASLLFVVIFGVTVLVNRQKSAKAKQPIPLSEDMLRELDKSHMGGFDEIHQMKERDLPHVPSGKRMSTAFIDQLAYSPGDSWRSEWTPQLSKYMQQQHYTPDSGRGSVYGHAPHGYGYGGGGGSQLYGQTGGGGSQLYGYTGEYTPRSHYGGRRRSDYDDSF